MIPRGEGVVQPLAGGAGRTDRAWKHSDDHRGERAENHSSAKNRQIGDGTVHLDAALESNAAALSQGCCNRQDGHAQRAPKV